MLSNDERCILHRHQVAEVICQFRFPEILIIGTNPPAQFQEMIRDTFPLYSIRKEKSGDQPVVINHQFSTSDNRFRVNLTSGFISLTCTKYSRWEEFAQMLDKPLAVFIQTYQPACFTRIGLRYLNFISRKDLALEGTHFSELIQPCYLGPLAEMEVSETAVNQCTVDAQLALSGGCILKVHAGPGMVKRNGNASDEPHFIFDQDLFTKGTITVNTSTSILRNLHHHAYRVFRGAITDQLFQAMDPEPF